MCVFSQTCDNVGDASLPRQLAADEIVGSAEFLWSGRRALALPFARKVFTDRRIRRAPDCARVGRGLIRFSVTLSPPIGLFDAEKLDALRRLDQFREWRSLDDKRFCLVCAKIITGRQIQVEGGTRGNGPQRLSCPSERCNSIPMDWVLPTDEILAKVERMVAKEREASVTTHVSRGNGGHEPSNGGHNGIGSRLREFAFYFKRRL